MSLLLSRPPVKFENNRRSKSCFVNEKFGRLFRGLVGYEMGLEPTTTGITILDSTN